MATLNFFDILSLCPHFFDDADIDERIDKKVMTDTILHRCGTLMPIYTNSQMFKYFSDSFFAERKSIINQLVDTLDLEYNPIDNYSKVEEIQRTISGKVTNGGNATSSNENKVSAYDSDGFTPKEMDTATSTTNQTTDDNHTEKSNVTTRGNIGTRTPQEMIRQERKVALFDIYKWIAIEFEQNFFIRVS